MVGLSSVAAARTSTARPRALATRSSCAGLGCWLRRACDAQRGGMGGGKSGARGPIICLRVITGTHLSIAEPASDGLLRKAGVLLAADRRLRGAYAEGVWQSRLSCSSRLASLEMRCCIFAHEILSTARSQARLLNGSTSQSKSCSICRFAPRSDAARVQNP